MTDERDYDLMRCGACGTKFKRKRLVTDWDEECHRCPRCKAATGLVVVEETPVERELRVSRSRMNEAAHALQAAKEVYARACTRYREAHVAATGHAPSNNILRTEAIAFEEGFGS